MYLLSIHICGSNHQRNCFYRRFGAFFVLLVFNVVVLNSYSCSVCLSLTKPFLFWRHLNCALWINFTPYIIRSRVLFHCCVFYCPCAVVWTSGWVYLWGFSRWKSHNVKLPLVDLYSHPSVIHVYCFLQSWSRELQSWQTSIVVTAERESRVLWEIWVRCGPDSDQSGHLAEAWHCFNWICCWPQPSEPIQQ